MVGFLPRPVAKAQAVKDLKTPTLKAVGLATKYLGVSLIYNASLDAAVRHPRSGH